MNNKKNTDITRDLNVISQIPEQDPSKTKDITRNLKAIPMDAMDEDSEDTEISVDKESMPSGPTPQYPSTRIDQTPYSTSEEPTTIQARPKVELWQMVQPLPKKTQPTPTSTATSPVITSTQEPNRATWVDSTQAFEERIGFRLPAPLRGFRAALIFLTRFPVGGFPFSRADWRWSTAYFPLVGLLLGTIQALMAWCLLFGFGPWTVAWLVVGSAMLMTGAFHEDGLADTADAMGGSYDPQKLLIILKDSRIGSFGAAALIVTLGLRVTLLARMGLWMPIGLLLSQCVARLPPIWLMRLMPYVTEQGTAKSRDVTRAGWTQVGLATLWPTALLTAGLMLEWYSWTRLLGIAFGMVFVFGICAWRFYQRAGGLTGDFLGALEQIMEIVILGGLVWNMHH
ncbi:MAG: adenosylcobinamide-GDP ribazoletransferase [Myxococcota bacterium]